MIMIGYNDDYIYKNTDINRRYFMRRTMLGK